MAAVLTPNLLAAGQAEEFFALHQRARQLYDQGRFQAAVPVYEKASELALKTFGPRDGNAWLAMQGLGICYKNIGRYEEALTLHNAVLLAREQTLGTNHPDVGISLNNLGRTYDASGNLEKAESHYRRAIALYESLRNKDDLGLAMTQLNLGNVYLQMGLYEQAEPLYLRSLVAREARLPKDDPEIGASLHDLAHLYQLLGQFTRAESAYRRSLAICEAKLGPEHPRVALSLHNQAVLFHDMGLYEKAEAAYLRALAIRRKQLGERHSDVAQTLNALATVEIARERPEKAEPLLRQSAEIYEAALGTKHPDTATPLENLGLVLKARGEYAKAESLYRRALAIRESSQGAEHNEAAYPVHNLAQLFLQMGDLNQAEGFARRAATLREKKLGLNHPQTAFSLGMLGSVLAAGEHWSEAVDTFDGARRAVRNHVVNTLPALTPAEQLSFLEREYEDGLHDALTVGWQQRTDRTLCERSAAWLLNGKAVAHEALAERSLLERDLTDPRRQTLAQELKVTRQRRAALALAVPQPGQETEHARRLEQLAAQQQNLENQLVAAGGWQRARGAAWIDLAELRKSVPADSVLIDIARFRPRNFAARRNEPYRQDARYAAWLVPAAGSGAVKVVDLGPAGVIESAVQAVRTGLSQAAGSRGQPGLIADEGEAEAERSLNKALAELAFLTLQPILPHLGRAQQLIVCLDGALWLAPWSALPLSDGRYVVEQFSLRYVVSGRDLLPVRLTTATTSPPIIMADPNYDLTPQAAQAATQAVLRSTAGSGSSTPSAGQVSAGLTRVPRLPGTAAEARAVAPKLQSYAGAAPLVYTEQWALEGVFKAVQRPKALLLSTHGFFLTDQQASEQQAAANSGIRGLSVTIEGRLLENPLLRCGLLLAGCNVRQPSPSAATEDGVLTGLEIVGTDLRGTELVVLSACETGLGQVRNGEGVAGLRQAFQLAGAKAVVSTLWQIPDQESAQLMTEFFTNLAQDQTQADALRNAQLALIKSRREQHGAAHPFFWAAFTLTGR